MDLKNGFQYRPDDENYFVDQMSAPVSFDGEEFIKLTEYYGLGGFRRQLGSWNAIFNLVKFDTEDWLNNITM